MILAQRQPPHVPDYETFAKSLTPDEALFLHTVIEPAVGSWSIELREALKRRADQGAKLQRMMGKFFRVLGHGAGASLEVAARAAEEHPDKQLRAEERARAEADDECERATCQHALDRHTGKETEHGHACTAPGCKCPGFVRLKEVGGDE